MKHLLLSAITLITWFPHMSLAAAPDLSKLPASEVLRLGFKEADKIEGNCYAARHHLCVIGTTPKEGDCQGDDISESRTRIVLDKMKFVLRKDISDQTASIYEGVPISSNIKEEEVYVLKTPLADPKKKSIFSKIFQPTKKEKVAPSTQKGEETPLPIRYFVTLKKTNCSLPPQQNTTISPPKQLIKPKSESPAHNTEKSGTRQPSDSITIPATKGADEAALNFLLQRKQGTQTKD